ncbi:MAG: PLD nuclease N-terminal domain-containing protein [Methylococcales bacterium]
MFDERVLVLIWLVPAILWVWALIDILKNEFSGSNKIIWLLVVFFLNIFGVILYYFMGRKQKIRKFGR